MGVLGNVAVLERYRKGLKEQGQIGFDDSYTLENMPSLREIINFSRAIKAGNNELSEENQEHLNLLEKQFRWVKRLVEIHKSTVDRQAIKMASYSNK